MTVPYAVSMLADAVADVDHVLAAAEDTALLLAVYDGLAAVAREVGIIRDRAATLAGDAMDAKRVTVDGITWERHRRVRRTGWQSDDLLRVVLDSRLVDSETGEVVDESPLDRVREVYPLSGSSARVAALRARGIDPDEFCATETDGWTLRRHG